MDRLEAMSLLIAVIDEGGFSAAARARRLPVATVSRKVADLETALGARLLVRSTRRVAPTDAGLVYLRNARRILDQVEEAERQAGGEFTDPKGELTLTAPVMFGQLHVLPLVAEFLEAFPQIGVRLLLSDRNASLIEDHIDMAVRIGSLADSSMLATKLGTMRTVTCVSPQLLERCGPLRRPAELAGFPCVAFEGPRPSVAWRFADPETRVPFDAPVASRLSVTTVGAAVAAALRHVGVVRLLHYQVAEALEAGDLRLVLEPFEIAPEPVSLVHEARAHLPLKTRSFLDFATPRLRAVCRGLAAGA